MKRDIDTLMRDRGIDALTVSGTPKSSRDLFYFTGAIAVTEARLFKKVGCEPILVVGGMERDEAAVSGLDIMTRGDFDLLEIVRSARSPLEAGVRSFLRICDTLGITGTVAFYGTGHIPYAHAFLAAIERDASVKVHVEPSDSILSEARMTKNDEEISRIESVSRRAQEVMTAVRDFLSSCSATESGIVDPDGKEVTIGRVKGMIRHETEMRGMVLDEPVIFSQGRDSAVPHSCGDDAAVLVPQETIVFDYCPQEAGPGYCCDITRTWCLGFVPDEVREIYEQVLEIHSRVLAMLEDGGLCSVYDKETNDYFERKGHPTLAKGTGKTEGYMHSLGHGIGLEVHERPRLSVLSKTEEHLAPGHVFTVEPGLYYPDRGIGVRLEDDVAVREDGTVSNLTGITKDILVPLRAS